MVNGQLPLRSTRLKPTDTIWMDSVEPKEQPPSAKDERGLLGARPSSYHYFRKKSKLAVGGSGGRRSIVNFLAGLQD